MRKKWNSDFPEVFAMTSWGKLKDASEYAAAKEKGQIRPAWTICEGFATKGQIDRLKALYGKHNPTLISPLKSGGGSNMLAVALANVIEENTGWSFYEDIIQISTGKKDRRTNILQRLVTETRYDGVVKNNNYLIVDDVLTSGGTIASLRGHLLSNGAKVIGAVVIATGSGNDTEIVPKLEPNDPIHKYDATLKDELGYDTYCLTAKELREMRRISSPEQLRAGLAKARCETHSCGIPCAACGAS